MAKTKNFRVLQLLFVINAIENRFVASALSPCSSVGSSRALSIVGSSRAFLYGFKNRFEASALGTLSGNSGSCAFLSSDSGSCALSGLLSAEHQSSSIYCLSCRGHSYGVGRFRRRRRNCFFVTGGNSPSAIPA
jgi:hypothetical protein